MALWFRAELDDGIVVENAPAVASHWGIQVVSWPDAVEAGEGRFRLIVEPDGSGFDVVLG